MISLACSVVNKKVRENINACLDENRLGQGRFIKEFEDRVAEFVGVKHAIAVSSGSMADMVALASLKAQRPDKNEVIISALTFIAQANSILINGLKPVFVDIGADLQINPEQVVDKINDKTLAIFPTHLLGKQADMIRLKSIAKEEKVFIVEDSCEGFGLFNDTDFATYSFFPSHTITTGEGGMLVTNNDVHAKFARSVMNHGREEGGVLQKFHFPYFGFNGKMSNVLAAIGCGVISEAKDVIEQRWRNVEYFNKLTKNNWFAESPHGYPIFYEDSYKRDSKLLTLEANKIEARKIFSCIPTQEWGWSGDYPLAEDIGRRGLYVPVHQELKKVDIETITYLL